LPVKSGKFAEVLRCHQRSTVSSEATAERLLSSITTQDFTGQSFGMIMLLLLGFSTNGMRQQFEFREHQWAWTANLTNPDGSPAFNFTRILLNRVAGRLASPTSSSPRAALLFRAHHLNRLVWSGRHFQRQRYWNIWDEHFHHTFRLAPTTSLLCKGAVNGNAVTGTWTLSGTTGCSGNGNFTINKS
jgi:hypothetical protein